MEELSSTQETRSYSVEGPQAQVQRKQAPKESLTPMQNKKVVQPYAAEHKTLWVLRPTKTVTAHTAAHRNQTHQKLPKK
jgi:hypothetical protein